MSWLKATARNFALVVVHSKAELSCREFLLRRRVQLSRIEHLDDFHIVFGMIYLHPDKCRQNELYYQYKKVRTIFTSAGKANFVFVTDINLLPIPGLYRNLKQKAYH